MLCKRHKEDKYGRIIIIYVSFLSFSLWGLNKKRLSQAHPHHRQTNPCTDYNLPNAVEEIREMHQKCNVQGLELEWP